MSDNNFDPHHDPYAQREAEKYDDPIPSRELILALIKHAGEPLKRKQIAERFDLISDEQLEALRRRLRAMERDGQLLFNRKKKYCLVNNQDLIAGRVLGHQDGFGFLKPDDGSDDLYLSAREMRSVLHNDRAVVSVSGVDRKGRREASIVEVLERNTRQVVGRFVKERGFYFVEPDNKCISQSVLISKEDINNAKKGQIVVAELLTQPNSHSQPVGRVTEILGKHMAPGMEIEMAIRSYDLPYQWPDALLAEIAPLTDEVPEQAKAGRVDLRDLPLVTIDGEDARDFDDAVFCEPTENGWRLLVAIADVSHYVQIGTELDKEAQTRSTSVYFPEKVIPMLPEILSNGLCSLNPNVDRLCMVCELSINRQGKVEKYNFFDAVMRSHARLTYTGVAEMIAAGVGVSNKSNKAFLPKLKSFFAGDSESPDAVNQPKHVLWPHINELYQLYKVMRQAREQRGAMDFDTQETLIVFGENRKIDKIVPVVRNDAHKLIEEFMITANNAAAQFLISRKIPHLLRVHEGPTDDKLLTLRTFLAELGLHLDGGDKPTPLDYMHLVNSVSERVDAHLIQTVLLRSMSQAVYSSEIKGHFGLALQAYAHFTSPIRRYPDLLVHRAIRHCLKGKPVESFYYGFPEMMGLGEHCSANERRADEATRQVVSWLKCEYMMDKVGEVFPGIITAVTSFGFFVELSDIYVEGLVHVSNLGQDFFHFDPTSHQLKGERTGKRFRLGDAVNVQVVRVDLDDKKIDFELVQASGERKKTRKRYRRK